MTDHPDPVETLARALYDAWSDGREDRLVVAIPDKARALLAQITPALVADEVAKEREALVKERDEALEWLSASQGYIADAVFALDKQEKAEARAERLEAALRLLHDNVVLAFPTLADLGPVANARAALSTTEAGHDPQA